MRGCMHLGALGLIQMWGWAREQVFDFEFEFGLKLCGSHAPFQVADLVETRCIIAQFILEPIGHIGIGCVALQRRE